MWPFRKRKEERRSRILKQVITSAIIGGAIGSVVGKHLLDKHEHEIAEDDEEGTTSQD